MSEIKYKHLEYHGKCIFNAVYDQEKKDEEAQTQELVKELLTIFHTGILSIVKESGEIPNIETLVTEVRAPLFQGILSEAILLSENQKRFSDTAFPIRAAVSETREKIESILTAFATKGGDAAIAYVNRLLKASASESSMFKAQAQEALRKHAESEAARKKTNHRLSEAVGKFQANRQMLLRTQIHLEEERSILIQERNDFARDAENARLETRRLGGKNTELEDLLRNKTARLNFANDRIRSIEKQLEENKRAQTVLASINENIKSIAKSGHTGPERLTAIITELKELRKKESSFQKQQELCDQLAQANLINRGVIDALQGEIDRYEVQIMKTDPDSLLDTNILPNEQIIKRYYGALDRYFQVSLEERNETIQNDTNIKKSKAGLEQRIAFLKLRGLDFVALGESELKRLSKIHKLREDRKEKCLSNSIIDGTALSIVRFLQSLLPVKQAISSYSLISEMGRRKDEIVVELQNSH